MPFELGIDWGYRHFIEKRKKFLVLESRYGVASKALSDFAGCDPERHNNDPKKLVRIVRDWLVSIEPKAAKIHYRIAWDSYAIFYSDLYEKEGYSKGEIDKMSIPELIQNMRSWVKRGGKKK